VGAVLFVLFIVIPIIELYVIVQVNTVIGLGWTLFALVAISIAGAALVKHEGLRAWQRTREALNDARMPAAEVLDGAFVLMGGALMLTPGFVTDAVGLLLVFPLTRAVLNRAVRSRVRAFVGFPAPRRDARQRRRPDRDTTAADDVIDVEVIDVERNTPPGPSERRGEIE
jgi:UPF0716 protein FxsA